MKHLSGLLMLLCVMLGFSISSCGLLPADVPKPTAEQVIPAVVKCTDIPGIVNEVSEVLLNGGSEADWKKLADGTAGRTMEDLLCATDQLIQDWSPQAGASQDPLRIDARAAAERYVKDTGAVVQRE